MANTVSNSNLRPEIWKKELFKDVKDNLYFTVNGLMGEGDGNIIQEMNDLKKNRGDTITLPLTTKLSGSPITSGELEGNEEAISSHSESVAIGQARFAVRLTGKLDEQKNAYDMRKDAKNKLSIRLQEYKERQIFLKLAGVNNANLVDVNGVAYSSDYDWSNTPDQIPAADTASGSGDRYLCANSSGADSLSTSDKLTPALISKVRIKAKLASPKIMPAKIKGKNYYVLFVSPYQAYDLKQDSTYAQALREAQKRGDGNPIFTGALGIWDNVIIHEHEYVPFLDISSTSNDQFAGDGNTTFGVDAHRALLCGRQAAVVASAKNDNGWVEKKFDYQDKTGFATGVIGGIQKIVFNSKEYAVIALDTYATDLS